MLGGYACEKTIIICVEGGFLHEVHTDLPEDIVIEVKVMDKDCRKVNPGGLETAEYAECETLLKKGGMRSIYDLNGGYGYAV